MRSAQYKAVISIACVAICFVVIVWQLNSSSKAYKETKTEKTIVQKEPFVPSPPTIETRSKDCIWEQNYIKAFDFYFFSETCSGKKTPFSKNQNKLAFQYQSISFFKKEEKQSIQDAIVAITSTHMTKDQKESCEVVKIQDEKQLYNKERYTIHLKDETEYTKKLMMEAHENPSILWGACGQYGAGNAIAYFEYQPQKKDAFIYVNIGQDIPPFDPDSLQFKK